jgi:hypothetical protein
LSSENGFTNKKFIMKKLTFLTLSAFLMLSVIPGQTKAATDTEAAKTVAISNETAVSTDQLSEIKSIELTSLSTSENKEVLKEASPIANEQGRHNGRYRNNRPSRDVDVTIQSDRTYGHHHGGAYIGGGGVLVLILILVLVL